MPRRSTPYPAEFRQQIIELVRAGQTPHQLSKEFGCDAKTIQHWVAQASPDIGKSRPHQAALNDKEREELKQLRRQVRQLQTERDILAKATAWFANKSEKTPIISSSL